MTARKTVNAREAIARMKRGDLPHYSGSYSNALFFDDGSKIPHAVATRLIKQGKIVRPQNGRGLYTLAQ